MARFDNTKAGLLIGLPAFLPVFVTEGAVAPSLSWKSHSLSCCRERMFTECYSLRNYT